MPTQLKGARTTTSASANEILKDYKDQIVDYLQTELPLRKLLCREYRSDTGGNVVLTLAKESMQAQEIAEGATPDFQHVDYKQVEVSVKEYGIRTGVTRTMIEDSRLDEIRNALDEARLAMDRNVIDRIMDEVKVGWYNADEDPPDYGSNTFDSNHDHIYNTGTALLTISGLTVAIQKINEHGYRANLVLINSKQLLQIQDLAAFTAGGVPSPLRDDLVKSGAIGTILGLSVIVNDIIPADKFVMVDSAVKPLAFVERRALTVEEGNAGFGIVDSFLSHRFGVKTVHKGAGVYVSVTT